MQRSNRSMTAVNDAGIATLFWRGWSKSWKKCDWMTLHVPLCRVQCPCIMLCQCGQPLSAQYTSMNAWHSIKLVLFHMSPFCMMTDVRRPHRKSCFKSNDVGETMSRDNYVSPGFVNKHCRKSCNLYFRNLLSQCWKQTLNYRESSQIAS